MMNNDNQISNQTTLFGFIGEHAGVSRCSALLNKQFKANGDDMMMIPMNIRYDDIYFTLSNMKNSHVNGAIISNEYVQNVLDVLDAKTEMVERSGMCDIIFREGQTLKGDVFITRVLSEKLKDLRALKVAVIGIGSHAKAFSLLACGFEVSYFYDSLEELMEFCKQMQIAHPDINRIAPNMDVDLSNFDAVLDCSDFETLGMIQKLPPFCLDMKNQKQISGLKVRANQLGVAYIGYDEMIEDIAKQAYKRIKKG